MSIMQRLRAAARRIPCGTLLLAAVAIGLQFSPSMCGPLQYDRAAIQGGEWWRVITCHLTHTSFDHLVWDVGTLLLLGWLCELENRRRWAICVGLSAIGIPAAIWWLLPELQTYRGLSGIDSALFVLVAVNVLLRSLREESRTSAVVAGLLLTGFVAKTCYELATGVTLFVDSVTAGMTPIPLAHVVGAVVGLVVGTATWRALLAATALPLRVKRLSFKH